MKKMLIAAACAAALSLTAGGGAHARPDLVELYTEAVRTADAAALELLPGIGPARARDILEYREKYGGFGGEYELLAIPGFSLELVEGLIDYICVEDSQ